MAITAELQNEMLKQAIEQEIAAVFDAEIRKVVRDFRSIGRYLKKKQSLPA